MSYQPTANTVERLTAYLPHWLNREVRIQAERAGQPISTFVQRALEAAVGKVPPPKREASR